MKNIFNHNKHTSTQAKKCTNFVILKSAVVTSILKKLSKHTSQPAYQRTILLLFLLFGFVLLNAQMVGELGRWEYGPTEAIAVKGNTAYISSGSYLWVMDISTESNPRLISEMKLENYINYIRRIGNYLYVSKNDTLLNIYDIHTDTIPTLVNQIEGEDSDFPWKEIIYTGNTLYISGYFNRQYFINDTISPTFTRIVGFTRDINNDSTVLVGTMQEDREIRVYDLTQIGDIYDQTDDYYTTEKIRGIKVTYPYVYFGYGSQGIGIMDISNLYDIKLKKTVATGGNTYDVEIIEDTILIAAKGLNGIGIYDVEDDTLLTEIGVCETNGYTYELEVIGNRLYVGARSGGLIIVDISDKSNPTVVGEYRGYGESRRMAIEGDRMYVASGDGGVMIMDIT
ncbi:MAG: LVIVD repeat-containing protein, partial [bacterium]